MIWFSILLLLFGVGLSAFFSGSETGFYRASRVRIVMDALDGNWLSKCLLIFANQPAFFVATALIGNNLANYITSLGVVLFTRSIFPSDNAAVELLAPIMMSPFLYVYGESLPKNLFFLAPNRLLKLAAPLLLVFSILFAPIALVLWGLAQLLERFIGESPDKVRLALARKELLKVLDEGEQAGIIHRTQKLLAQNFFVQASKPVREFCTPMAKVTAVSESTSPKELRRIASRNRMADIAVYANQKTNLVGYYRLVDMLVTENDQLPTITKLHEVEADELFGEAILQLQNKRESLAKVVDQKGKTVGLISMDQLTNPLMNGPLVKLRR